MPRQYAHGQGRPGHKADAQFGANGQNVFFAPTKKQRIFTLHGRQRQNGMRLANGGGADFAQTPMQNLALFHQILNHARQFLYGHLRIGAVLAKQIDAVGAQAAQHVVHHPPHARGLAVHLARAPAGLLVNIPAVFGGILRVVAQTRQCFAQYALAFKRTVSLGGIEKSNAVIQA